jgi:hypothetical protein
MAMNPPRYSGSGVEVRGAMAVIAAARPLDLELRSATIRPWASTGARWRVSAVEVAERRATEAQVLEEAERLVAVWNERQD